MGTWQYFLLSLYAGGTFFKGAFWKENSINIKYQMKQRSPPEHQQFKQLQK